MSTQEIPLVFDCEGCELIGMVHVPAQPQCRGMLSIVAGGPQYRSGVCRMQVQMARQLAAAGIAVMRFDYRGLGDSEGVFRGFQDVEADLAAAIRAFKAHAPGLEEVVLWGGCDAASAVMINAWKYPEVTGIVIGNPWVHSEQTGDAVALQHFSSRLRDKDFWLKLLRLQYNPLPALITILRSVRSRLMPAATDAVRHDAGARQDRLSLPFVERMCIGLGNFKGDVLMLMSGRSLLSKEFDELVASRPAWQQAMRSPRHMVRFEIADGDQAFSTMDSRIKVSAATLRWLHDVRNDLASTNPCADMKAVP